MQTTETPLDCAPCKVSCLPSAFEAASVKHDDVNGMQVSVGAEVKAYGDKAE